MPSAGGRLGGSGLHAITHRVVVVEDNRAIRQLTAILLRDAGYRVITAETGEDGIELILNDHPHLVLLDLNLPGIDGYTVLERVRDDASVKDTTVVAFTAIAVPGERDRLLSVGFDSYIEKPIDPARFVDVITAILADPAVADGRRLA